MSKWTPVKKRLPESQGSYWITTSDGDVRLGFLKPDLSGFRNRKAIAWMPYPKVPQPYKENK